MTRSLVAAPAALLVLAGCSSLPVAEALCGRILSLPMHAYLADATAERIVTAFLLALRSS